MTGNRKSIEHVVRQGWCTGCGTCASICPTSAIRMIVDNRHGVYAPELQPDSCNQCGLCCDACPGHSIDLEMLSKQVFGGEPADALVGTVTGTYLAHSTDSGLRHCAASGGLATALLIHSLETGLIDGALVTRMKPDRPLEPEPFIARTKEEVLASLGSKYCPVPANVALRTILEEEGRYAVVGLPCHIHGVRKAEAASAKLRQRIILHLGIFCAHTCSFKMTEFLLRRLNICEEDVSTLSYRGGGWPGGMKVKLKDGSERFVPTLYGSIWSSMFGSFFFTPTCCLSCPDVLNELADISLGDPWLPEVLSTEHEGKSLVLSRSPAGDSLLQSASSSGAISLSDLDAADVVRAQRMFLHFKKVNLEARLSYLGSAGRRVTAPPSSNVSRWNRLAAMVAVTNQRFASSRLGARLLARLPSFILLKYNGYFHKLYHRVIGKDFKGLDGMR